MNNCLKIEWLENIESFNDYPLCLESSYRMYIGRNIPKKPEDKIQHVITQDELDLYFDTQPYVKGCTRIPGKGLWEGESELSEEVILLNVTLREVLYLALDYIDYFEQVAVYIELSYTNSFEFKEKK